MRYCPGSLSARHGMTVPGPFSAVGTYTDAAGVEGPSSGPTGETGDQKTRLAFSATIQRRRDNPCALLDVLSRCNLTILCFYCRDCAPLERPRVSISMLGEQCVTPHWCIRTVSRPDRRETKTARTSDAAPRRVSNPRSVCAYCRTQKRDINDTISGIEMASCCGRSHC